MSRLMSVALTEQAVRDRTKTVTRRLGWWEDKMGNQLLEPGQTVTLCRKVMGRKRKDGTVEPLVRICDVEIVDIGREPLREGIRNDIWDLEREGFPDMTPDEFVAFFCASHKGCTPDTIVTRIEWRYLQGNTP